MENLLNFYMLHLLVATTTWGIDIVRTFENVTAQGYKYVYIGRHKYFQKWAEAIQVCEFMTLTISLFFKIHVIIDSILPLNKLYVNYQIRGINLHDTMHQQMD